jgi:putative permease
VVSVILGSQFAGIVGMIVSIPLAAFLKLLFQEIYRELYTNRTPISFTDLAL